MIDTGVGVKPNGETDFPGGKVEYGENQIEALDREIAEETGLIVKIQDPIAQWFFVKPTGMQITGATYLCQYLEGQVLLSDEHSDFFWLPINNITCFESIRRLELQGKIEKLQFYGLGMFTINSN